MGPIEKGLRDAKLLIADPKCWTRGTFHRLDTRSPTGHRYCAIGAIDKASAGRTSVLMHARGLLQDCTQEIAGVDVVTLNDLGAPRKGIKTRGQSHKTLMEAFECAIRKAEEKTL